MGATLLDRPMRTEETSSGMERFLRGTEPFRRLSSTELEQVLHQAQQTHHFPGEHVYSEGEEVRELWILETGRIEIIRHSSDGKPRAVETIFPGQVFGSIYDLVDDERTYAGSAVAYVESTCIKIPFATFIYLTHRSLPFMTGLCSLYSQRIGQMEARASMAGEQVAKRAARVLVDLATRQGNRIPVTKREIAELAGTTVETAIRTLGGFEKRRWISSSRGEIQVLSIPKLASFSQGAL